MRRLWTGPFLRRTYDAVGEVMLRKFSGLGLRIVKTAGGFAAQQSAFASGGSSRRARRKRHEGHEGVGGPAAPVREAPWSVAGKGPRRARSGALPSCPSCRLRGLGDEPSRVARGQVTATEAPFHPSTASRFPSPFARGEQGGDGASGPPQFWGAVGLTTAGPVEVGAGAGTGTTTSRSMMTGSGVRAAAARALASAAAALARAMSTLAWAPAT